MLKTVTAIVRQGKIELSDRLELPEGTKVLVTILPDNEAEFWSNSSQTSLDKIWNNSEDDVYAELLEE